MFILFKIFAAADFSFRKLHQGGPLGGATGAVAPGPCAVRGPRGEHPPPKHDRERTEGGPSHRAPRQLSTVLSFKAISQNEFISSRTYINHTLQIYFYLYF